MIPWCQVSAVVIHVDHVGGGDYLTIQEGIGAAADGDTVLVAPGEYQEALVMHGPGKNIVLISQSGPAVTHIVGNQRSYDPLLDVQDVGPPAAITGFTLRDNRTSDGPQFGQGGAIYVKSSDLAILGNVIQDCYATSEGGGVYAEDSVVRIAGNTVQRNRSGYGGGISLFDSVATIDDNDILENSGFTFDLYWGGGIAAVGGDITVIGNRINANDSLNGGAIYLYGNDGYSLPLSVTMSDNQVIGNEAIVGSALYVNGASLDVRGNLIADNVSLGGSPQSCIALFHCSELALFEDNVIANNGGSGFVVGYGAALTISGNSLGGHEHYEMRVQESCSADSIDMSGNWWGTVDPDSVASLIRDCHDDPAITTCVDFDDWCEEPSCQGGAMSLVPEQIRSTSWGRVKALWWR